MKVIDTGYIYEMDKLDVDKHQNLHPLPATIRFVKREGEKYPGNVGSHAGVTVQEVCRVLIARLQYVDNQEPDWRNKTCIHLLRKIIWTMECRASKRHGLVFHGAYNGIESRPVCKECGHIVCKHTNPIP